MRSHYFAVMTFLTFSGTVGASGPVVQLTDHSGIAKAVMQGDPVNLLRVLDTAKAPAEVRQTALAAIKGDLGATEKSARACRNAGQAMLPKAPSAIQLTMLCNMFLTGAATAQGDGKAWAEAITWTNDVGAPALAAHQGLNGDGTDGRQMAAIRKLASEGPTLTTERSLHEEATKVTLLAARDGSNAVLPTVTININGADVTALVDSGSTSNIVISEPTAKRLGIASIPGSESSVGSPYTPLQNGGQRSFGIVDSLSYADMSYRHYMVSVVRGGLPFDAVIGLPLLLSHDTVTLSDHEITTSYVEKCDDPLSLRFQTDPFMNGRLVLDGKVNGRLTSLAIDSGADVTFLGTGVLYSQLHDDLPPVSSSRVHTAGVSTALPSTSAPVTLSLGKSNTHISDALFFPSAPGPVGGVIGARFLRSKQVSFDLKRGEACVLKSP